MPACHHNCFFARQQRRHRARGLQLRLRLQSALVDVGRIGFDRDAGRGEKRPAHLALRGENQWRAGKPRRHRLRHRAPQDT